MYSYEERIRAVTLYIKLGKRTGATIRQLGYPTKNSLKSWHEEYERCLDLPSGYVRSMPKYSQTQKERAVEHYAEHGRRIAAIEMSNVTCEPRAVSQQSTQAALFAILRLATNAKFEAPHFI
jgi:transposase-like protein